MKALVINCSPVKNGATAEIVHVVSEQLAEKMTVKSICIDDYQFDFCKGFHTWYMHRPCFHKCQMN